MLKHTRTIFICCALLLALTVSCRSLEPLGENEVRGRCPECGKMVTGHLICWDGVDANGNMTGGMEYSGACRSCGTHVYAPIYLSDTDPRRSNIEWQTR